ncbi:hypothetical protein CFOL_v3_13893 [Cephalotus follicularis]|uniref:DUF7356 domain-containing protein n=1 Tax=Cephalotus follicularis TaxID=3775 RepID=A0A1Q3BR23_CEPFO|nr:hypothetical protein CFOL_v3_13893 [Cephalotus follicularis]
MDKNVIVAVISFFLIVAVVSGADVAPVPVNSTAIPVSPTTIPGKNSDPKPNNVTDPQNVNGIEKNVSKDSNNTDTVKVSPTPPQEISDEVKNQNNSDTVKVNKDDEKKQGHEDNKTRLVFDSERNCTGSPCSDLGKLVACISSFEKGSKQLVVLVHNGGEETLEVKLSVSSSVEKPLKEFKVPQHQTEKINISLAVGRNTKITLNAGRRECVLRLNASVSEETYFLRLPSYDQLVTPVNGAYFLILTGIILGGTWGCCKFWKRRWQSGVPYQELEMGLPESVLAANVETAEGWDQGWDDDWDEENAVRSPGGHRIGNISANGLTSRSSNSDGWENDWDD